ncbi:MAG: hypothetical protein FJZ04_03070 [Candidatus Moranbacteria bacterium]|nr:hypothetical protein [Candidatus Moranbacteria bacterium]
MPAKVYFLPAVFNSLNTSAKTIAFWRKISQERDRQSEIHLFLVFEGRNTHETYLLGQELWKIGSANITEAILNRQAFLNPEQICESIIKLFNDYFLSFRERSSLQNWNELHLVAGVATESALYFTRMGDARVLFSRHKNLFVADEDISSNRSPQFQPPLSEIAEGSLRSGDRILITTPALLQLFSLDDLATFINPQNFFGAFANIIKSIEISRNSLNLSFLWGEVSPADPQKEAAIQRAAGAKIKQSQIGGLDFWEFNLLGQAPQTKGKTRHSALLPWGRILQALSSLISRGIKNLGKIIYFPLRPIFTKINSLPPLRKTILLSCFLVFLAFLGYVSLSILNQPKPNVVTIDYQAAFSEAEKLRQEAQSALIYQDEEKARKNLTQAINLLDQATHSGEWGIKALKLKRGIEEELAGLEKIENISEATKIWSAPTDKGTFKKLAWVKSGSLHLISEKWFGDLKITDASVTPEDYQRDQFDLTDKNIWFIKALDRSLIILPQEKSMIVVNPNEKTISAKKPLGNEFKESFSAAGSFDNNVYFFDPGENEIKLFAYENDNLAFKRNWLKPESRDEFKNSPVLSLAIDGSIYSLTLNGQISRFSGGKKTNWKAEDLTAKIEGKGSVLLTNAALKNLYVLNPENKKIIAFEKETGKLKFQIQNNLLGQAVDFQIDEGKKEIYFIIPKALFKVNFN